MDQVTVYEVIGIFVVIGLGQALWQLRMLAGYKKYTEELIAKESTAVEDKFKVVHHRVDGVEESHQICMVKREKIEGDILHKVEDFVASSITSDSALMEKISSFEKAVTEKFGELSGEIKAMKASSDTATVISDLVKELKGK